MPLSTSAATITLEQDKTSPNIRLFLKIKKIEKLAGLKISLTYPPEILAFHSAAKTEATSSFMHVVNDKKPGKLIIVLASAKGISGTDIILLNLDFSVLTGETITTSLIDTTYCQLMSEDLKEITCNTTPSKIEF